MSFSMKVTGAEGKLDPIIRDEVFRIGREAVGNAFKHSNGSEVAAEILYDPGAIKMRIRDNGDGIEPSSPPRTTGALGDSQVCTNGQRKLGPR